MADLLTWKFLAPAGGVAALLGIIVMRPGNPREEQPAKRSQSNYAVLGYLSPKELPDSATLLPPPPRPGSNEMKQDEQARAAALKIEAGPRYQLATLDANRDQANTAAAFQCAFGAAINQDQTPNLMRLLSRVRLDMRAATYPSKLKFKRQRPFVTYGTKPCHAEDEQNVRGDGSYPSARATVGWAYALLLAEINPARTDEILQRGREFGRSRLICDEEWQSDVDAARSVATTTLARIQEKPAFREDLGAARKETEGQIKLGIDPTLCQKEEFALASR